MITLTHFAWCGTQFSRGFTECFSNLKEAKESLLRLYGDNVEIHIHYSVMNAAYFAFMKSKD